jgi:NAD kinase
VKLSILLDSDDSDSDLIEGCTRAFKDTCTHGVDVVILLGGDGTLLYFNSLLQDCMMILSSLL